MSDLERTEESRERNEGFAYEDYHERMSAQDERFEDEDETEEEDEDE